MKRKQTVAKFHTTLSSDDKDGELVRPLIDTTTETLYTDPVCLGDSAEHHVTVR